MKSFYIPIASSFLLCSALAQEPLEDSTNLEDRTDTSSELEPKENQESTDEPSVDEASGEGVVVKTEIPKQITLTKPSPGLKLLAPWAPKPLQAPPIGWRYVAAAPDQAYKTEVKLKSGNKLSLNITPYVLVPEDSPLVVQVLEPGYDPLKGYRQTNSVTATLASSNQMLLNASEALVKSIADLEELLLTLPKPDSNPPQNP